MIGRKSCQYHHAALVETKFPGELRMDDLIQNMALLGFSAYETRVYYALCQRSPMNGHEVSKAAGIPTSKVYETLQRLQQKGAVFLYQSNSVLYAPVPYENILSKFQDQVKKACNVIETTFAHLEHAMEPTLTWSLSETESIVKQMQSVIDQAQTVIFAGLWDPELTKLDEALKAAHGRGVELQIAIYGTHQLGIPYTYDLTKCGESAQERLNGRRLSVIVADRRDTVIAELSEGNSEGIWTQNKVVSLLGMEYVKEDIMGRGLINELGEEKYAALRREQPELRNILRFEE